ncbi:MAG TPA: hypothetical protein VIN08_07075 [Ohtaekwangia sp.]
MEITTFRLNGHTYQEFIKANHDIDEWLCRQPGFQSRYIAEDDGGVIVDVLIWNSVADGTKAMHKIITETRDSKVHDMIDHGTVVWKCIPIYRSYKLDN